MEIKSWFEDFRENIETGEKLEIERQAAREREEAWRADDEELFIEDEIMSEYANLLMEKELKQLGAYIIQKYPEKVDRWKIAEAVYQHYGNYYMYVNRPKEAIKWFNKAIRNDLPYPYPAWKDLIAAHIESGEHKKADHWIRRYIKHYTTESGKVSPFDLMDFAKYYLQIKQFEKALAMMLEATKAPNHFYHIENQQLAKAYFGVGEMEKGFKCYEEYVEQVTNDEQAWAELALFYYNYNKDIDIAEAYYLKSMEVADKNDNKNWNMHIYKNLTVIFSNHDLWDKCFHYLKLHYQSRFEGMEAEAFCQLIDNRPMSEDNETILGFYYAVLDFENSPLRPGGIKYIEGIVSENPAVEVKIATKKSGDLHGLFKWDDAMDN